MEGIVKFVPNVLSFLLTSCPWRWYAVGAYVPPNNAPAVYCLDQALEAESRVMEVILMGGLDVRLREPLNERKEELATALADRGLVNMTVHFTLKRRYIGEGRWMWQMRQEVRHVTGSVELNDALHGFMEERGTGAATLEANLSQKLAGISHENFPGIHGRPQVI